jgi:hypothetical protein
MSKRPDTRNYGKLHPRFAEGGAVGDDYNTDLGDDEPKFQEWKSQHAPRDSGADYDLRGAYKSGLTPDPQSGHWPDTFKKPNHPTFSNQSQYATGANAAKAGHWEGPEGPDQTFVPPKGADE